MGRKRRQGTSLTAALAWQSRACVATAASSSAAAAAAVCRALYLIARWSKGSGVRARGLGFRVCNARVKERRGISAEWYLRVVCLGHLLHVLEPFFGLRLRLLHLGPLTLAAVSTNEHPRPQSRIPAGKTACDKWTAHSARVTPQASHSHKRGTAYVDTFSRRTHSQPPSVPDILS
eukprot:521893-Rhodomonas_salina.1